ncbi:hypothetical protein EST38_g4829 [Candolleomyces aberdarensis]|uniref:Nephrocystin 3-like N-terminal domain-containing protein n=1 Tax=Candolleomyces aberdarensis TaxID=2316362 RepID=A0A4Q2DLJ8_9AGAR|nr:hypothetical protein EST38_g4829 [Candolleomyces aberdarensis]
MERLPNTLACHLAKAIPQAAELIMAAVNAEPGLLDTESNLSLDTRLHSLVYRPFKEAIPIFKSFSRPYLIVIDGLDECDEKEGIQEFLLSTFRFFEENPYTPLRIFITSRVEQHIHLHLSGDRVLLKDLGDESSLDDIKTFMDIVFKDAVKASPVIQAYIRQNGSWPKPHHLEELLKHIGGSFILASTVAKFIFHGIGSTDSHLTPMDRLPLAIKIDPGLDGLYSQTLARAEHLPHFSEIISIIALLAAPLPIAGIAELLGIQAYEVAHVLVDLQAIIQVPGTDDAPGDFSLLPHFMAAFSIAV